MSSVIKSPRTESSAYFIKQQFDSVVTVEKHTVVDEAELLESVNEQVDNILEEARKQSELIIQQAEFQKKEVEEYIRKQQEDWENEKEKIADEASQIGYQEGYGEGKRTAKQEYSAILEKINQTLICMKEQEEKILEDMEPQLLEAGIRIANKIMNQTIDEDPTRFIDIAKRIVREVKEENDIKVYVHPSFYEEVYKQKEDLKALLHQEALLTLYPDESIGEKQCIVESSYGRIEGGIDNQLQQIKQALTKCLEEG